ncbi:hypothetical protein HDZ31DRAFT_12322, partial [Schizophyllum fasciatum]
MAMFGRIVHYSVDAVLLSTVLAGVRRSSGFTVNPDTIPEGTPRTIFEKYISVGESVFDMAQATVVNSQYFKR